MIEWLTPLLLLAVFGGFAYRDAHNDKSPRAPAMQWWTKNRSMLVWWAEKPTAAEVEVARVRTPRR